MATVLEICKSLPLRSVAAGETVMTDGATDSLLYILVEGAVEIVKGDVQINTVSEPGAFFGEVSVLLGLPHMATVQGAAGRRSSTSPPIRLAFLRSNPEIALAVAALLARRLHSLTTYLVDLKRQFEGHDDHLSMVDEVLESAGAPSGAAAPSRAPTATPILRWTERLRPRRRLVEPHDLVARQREPRRVLLVEVDDHVRRARSDLPAGVEHPGRVDAIDPRAALAKRRLVDVTGEHDVGPVRANPAHQSRCRRCACVPVQLSGDSSGGAW